MPDKSGEEIEGEIEIDSSVPVGDDLEPGSLEGVDVVSKSVKKTSEKLSEESPEVESVSKEKSEVHRRPVRMA